MPTIYDSHLTKRIQTKTLGANVTVSGDITALTFQNLVSGRFYRISGSASMQGASGDDSVLRFYNSTSTSSSGATLLGVTGTMGISVTAPMAFSLIFQATGTFMVANYFKSGASPRINGDGTKGHLGTFITMEELPMNYQSTTDFT